MMPLLAETYTLVPALKMVGEDDAIPGNQALTSVVLALVPSVYQTSFPAVLLLAKKSAPAPNGIKPVGVDALIPGLMSATRLVPLQVPSDFQSSRPLIPSSTEK